MDQCKKKEAASGLVRQGRCPPIKPTQTGEQAAGWWAEGQSVGTVWKARRARGCSPCCRTPDTDARDGTGPLIPTDDLRNCPYATGEAGLG